jgi:hypothetical protein
MRRLGLGIVAVLLLGAILYTGWWFYLEQRLSAGLDAWIAARRAEGWTVSVGSRHLGGWPVVARLELKDAVVQGGGPILPVRIDWRADLLDLDLPVLSPAALVLRPREMETLSVGGGPAVTVKGGTTEIRLDLTRSAPPWPVAFTARNLRLAPASGGTPARISLLSGHADLDPGAPAGAPALRLQLGSGRVDLPAGRLWPLGAVIQSVTADIAVSGPVPPPGSPEDRARAWRDAGGTVTLDQGSFRWGPLEGVATGHGGLDGRLQPDAEAVMRVTGYAQAMDVLAAHRVLPDRAALVAKAVLSLLAQAPAEGGAPVLTVPLSLHDGLLTAHGIPLVLISPLAWNAG